MNEESFQKYEVLLTLTFEAPTYPEDPNDVFELANLEKQSIEQSLPTIFPELEVIEFKVTPVIGE